MRLQSFRAPQRYCFKDPDTGFDYEEVDQKTLIQRIVSYRAQNNLPPLEHLEMVLPNYWCGLPENAGDCEICPRMERGLYAYLKGGIALVQMIAYPEKHICSQEEADRRATICLSCPYNIFPDRGPFVLWADKLAEAAVGDRKAKHHDSLGSCEVCTCNLRCKVFYSGDMGLTADQKTKMNKVGCWQPAVKGD